MKTVLLAFALLAPLLGGAGAGSAPSKSFMSDKTEASVDLEVSGAEALCQTDDGYVWIAQYSGLTRYDSKEYVTYKSFTENGVEHSIINVRALASKENTLYVATSDNLFVYQDYEFSHIDADFGTIKDIILDDVNDLLYVSSSDKGATVYDTKNKTSKKVSGLESGNVNEIALDTKRDTYYYQLDSGVYDKTGKEIFLYPTILDIYSYGDILYIGEKEGIVVRYNMETGSFLSDIVIPDQVNKMLYSPNDEVLFVGCENGLYCVSLAGEEPVTSSAGDLENKSQLVDLMIDYEGNLWVASHYIGASGVSIITKNALLELLYDDDVWKGLDKPPSFDRNIYAIERYGDILYIVSALHIYLYDMNQGKILQDNVLMETIQAYADQKTAEKRALGGDNETFVFTYAPKDVEVFNDKLYFAVSGIGLIEYDPSAGTVAIYDADYISSHIAKTVGDPDLALTQAMRSLRSFDGYLAAGYSRGIVKFDGTKFSVMHVGSNILYINKSNQGKLIFDRTGGLFEVDDEFTTMTEIPTAVKGVSGNRLKFLVDGDYIYYNLNSRLFRLEKANGQYASKEITIPYVKGSLVELSKIEYNDKSGNVGYKYVIVSQTQIYIADSLDGDRLENFEFYDSTNGLQPIIANTSGYYDREGQKYYFQSTNGIYVYDFNETKDTTAPVKVGVASVELDGKPFFGNTINITKDTYRVTINLSVLGFRPNKGFSIYYKMDGIDKDYQTISDSDRNINYTNLPGGDYAFHAYAVDEYGQRSNEINIQLIKEKKVHEHAWFWVISALLALSLVVGIAFLIIRQKTRQALRKQLEYKNITVESIQAIARTIDAKDEYTNGHSTRVGYYSKLIAQAMGMSDHDVDNIYYIALLHDIGKIAIPDKILNKPGRLTDEEFAVMKSHTTRGARILQGISTIPHIVEGAKSHHEKYDGSGYPEGLKGEEIPLVARIICAADCFDAMASKRVYKPAFTMETVIGEFKRCAGTQFDPHIAEIVVQMIESGKLKPLSMDNTYLGEDGKTHRVITPKPEEEKPEEPKPEGEDK